MKKRKLFPIPSKEFGARLDALMKLNNIDSSIDLAVKLLKYESKPKSNTQEYLECKKKAKTIQNHLSLGNLSEQCSSKSLASCFISEYCDFFNCSADYFLGKIDYPTYAQIDISKELGLSVSSINQICDLKPVEKYILDVLFDKYCKMPALLTHIRQSISYAALDRHASIMIDDTYKKNDKNGLILEEQLNKRDVQKMLSHILNDDLYDIMELLYNDEVLVLSVLEYTLENATKQKLSLDEIVSEMQSKNITLNTQPKGSD